MRRGSVPGFFFLFFGFSPAGISFLLFIFSLRLRPPPSFSGDISLGSLGKSSPPMKLTKKHRISLKAHLGLGGRIYLVGLFFFSISLAGSRFFFSLTLSQRRDRHVFLESVDRVRGGFIIRVRDA